MGFRFPFTFLKRVGMDMGSEERERSRSGRRCWRTGWVRVTRRRSSRRPFKPTPIRCGTVAIVPSGPGSLRSGGPGRCPGLSHLAPLGRKRLGLARSRVFEREPAEELPQLYRQTRGTAGCLKLRPARLTGGPVSDASRSRVLPCSLRGWFSGRPEGDGFTQDLLKEGLRTEAPPVLPALSPPSSSAGLSAASRI